MKKTKNVQLLADKLQPMLQIIDMFMISMTDEEFDLLKESEKALIDHITMQHSAQVLTSAFGIETDTLNEEHKAKTLNILIHLLEERKQYMEDLKENKLREETINKNRQELMNIFRNW